MGWLGGFLIWVLHVILHGLSTTAMLLFRETNDYIKDWSTSVIFYIDQLFLLWECCLWECLWDFLHLFSVLTVLQLYVMFAEKWTNSILYVTFNKFKCVVVILGRHCHKVMQAQLVECQPRLYHCCGFDTVGWVKLSRRNPSAIWPIMCLVGR